MAKEMTTNEIKTTTQTVIQLPELFGTRIINPLNAEEEPEIEVVLKPIYTKEVRKAIVQRN